MDAEEWEDGKGWSDGVTEKVWDEESSGVKKKMRWMVEGELERDKIEGGREVK